MIFKQCQLFVVAALPTNNIAGVFAAVVINTYKLSVVGSRKACYTIKFHPIAKNRDQSNQYDHIFIGA